MLDCGHGQQKEEYQEKSQKIRQSAEQAGKEESRETGPQAGEEESVEKPTDGKEKIFTEQNRRRFGAQAQHPQSKRAPTG